MKTVVRLTLLSILVAACVGIASAGTPPEHPHYLHALSDLRYARALLDKLAMNEHRDQLETLAIGNIDGAIETIKGASIEDHQNLNDHPPIDAHITRSDRYRRALELLEAAHRDVTMEEDNAHSQGLQGRVIAEIDKAHHRVEELQARYNK